MSGLRERLTELADEWLAVSAHLRDRSGPEVGKAAVYKACATMLRDELDRPIEASPTDRIDQLLREHEYMPIHTDPYAWLCTCGAFWDTYEWRPDYHRAHVAEVLRPVIAGAKAEALQEAAAEWSSEHDRLTRELPQQTKSRTAYRLASVLAARRAEQIGGDA